MMNQLESAFAPYPNLNAGDSPMKKPQGAHYNQQEAAEADRQLIHAINLMNRMMRSSLQTESEDLIRRTLRDRVRVWNLKIRDVASLSGLF
jgi:hypothetical protein